MPEFVKHTHQMLKLENGGKVTSYPKYVPVESTKEAIFMAGCVSKTKDFNQIYAKGYEDNDVKMSFFQKKYIVRTRINRIKGQFNLHIPHPTAPLKHPYIGCHVGKR